jgi:hypothetical protein
VGLQEEEHRSPVPHREACEQARLLQHINMGPEGEEVMHGTHHINLNVGGGGEHRRPWRDRSGAWLAANRPDRASCGRDLTPIAHRRLHLSSSGGVGWPRPVAGRASRIVEGRVHEELNSLA